MVDRFTGPPIGSCAVPQAEGFYCAGHFLHEGPCYLHLTPLAQGFSKEQEKQMYEDRFNEIYDEVSSNPYIQARMIELLRPKILKSLRAYEE